MCIIGDKQFIVAGEDSKLRVYKGTGLLSEQDLIDLPSAMCSWYAETTSPCIPFVAISSGPYIFIFKSLKPYYKFTLPPLTIAPLEETIWAGLNDKSMSNDKALEVPALPY